MHVFILLILLLFFTINAQDDTQLTGVIAYTEIIPMPRHDVVFDCPGNIVLIRPDGSLVRRIETGCYDPSGLTWSANGERFGVGVLPWVYAVEANGSGFRRLTPEPSMRGYSAISPDAQTITYIEEPVSLLDDGTFDYGILHDYNLYVVAADGSAPPLQLTEDITTLSWLAWSQDSEWIAFQGTVPDDPEDAGEGVRDLYILNRDGTGLTKLTDGEFEIFGSAAWSPDGERVAFTAGLSGLVLQVYVINVESREIIRITESDAARYIFAPWRDVRLLVHYQERDQLPELQLIDLNTGARSILAQAEMFGGADWSPDGGHVVYNPSDGRTADICIVEIATLDEICLGVRAHRLSEPMWRDVGDGDL